MIDTDKYEGLNEVIDRIIDSDEISIDDLLADSMVVKNGIKELLAEVERLRKELDEVYQERDKYEGALNIALEHLGYQGADHEWFCREKYQCNVYGDEIIWEEE